MRKILITGALGFIGSVLVKKLLLDGYNSITVLDNIKYRQIGPIYDYDDPDITFVYGDVRDTKLLKTLVTHNDVIIPLAAIVGAPACDMFPDEATDVNHIQIKNIAEWLSREQMLIYPNSNSAYGTSKITVTEDSPRRPLSHYAKTKCFAEDEVLHGGNGVVLRLATVFGLSPRMRMDLLVNDFTYKAYTDGYLVLFESSFKRNYIHIQDVANTFIFMMDNYKKCNNKAFNVGLSNANLSKLELAQVIKKYLPELVIKDEEFKKDVDKRNYIVSNERLESMGWKPTKTVDDGIQELLKVCPIIKAHNDRNFTNL
jgi:nucleoside-diphosphate-sugar epimerase